jgi:hypothetical protein
MLSLIGELTMSDSNPWVVEMESTDDAQRFVDLVLSLDQDQKALERFINSPKEYLQNQGMADIRVRVADQNFSLIQLLDETDEAARLAVARTLMHGALESDIEPFAIVVPVAVFAAVVVVFFAAVGAVYVAGAAQLGAALHVATVATVTANTWGRGAIPENLLQRRRISLSDNYLASDIHGHLTSLGYSDVRQAALIRMNLSVAPLSDRESHSCTIHVDDFTFSAQVEFDSDGNMTVIDATASA